VLHTGGGCSLRHLGYMIQLGQKKRHLPFSYYPKISEILLLFSDPTPIELLPSAPTASAYVEH